MIDIPCVILAGGKSRRMGQDKALLPFGDYPTLTQFQLHKLTKHFQHVYVSCKDKSKFDFDANFIEDNLAYQTSAPLIALLSAFETLQCQTLCVIAVDTPFFDAAHFKKLIGYHDNTTQATIARDAQGVHPLCGLYSVNPFLLDSVLKKRYKMTEYLENINTRFVEIEDEMACANLNFQEEYRNALKRKSLG